jgi:hypothetical protein
MRTPRPGEWLAERTDLVVPPETVRQLAASAPASHARSYRMCGRVLRLGCDDGRYVERFAAAFRHMAVPGPGQGESTVDLVYLTRDRGPEGFPALLDPAEGRATVFEHESVSPTQLCAAMLIRGALPVRDRVVLHASVLERAGAVTAFVGRTHAGKTTLSLALALEKGVGFLSDEYCPVRIADGIVEPFPRALGIRRWTRGVLAKRGALPEAREGEDEESGQIEVDPASLRGFRLGAGGPLRNLVVVTGETGQREMKGIRDLDVEFVTPALLDDLRRVQGVTDVEPRPERPGAGYLVRVHVAEGAAVTGALLGICERHGMRLHGLLPAGAERPDFQEPPRLEVLEPFRGLVEVVRQTVNRTTLEREIGDTSLPRLLDAIAPAFRGTRFFRLRPGPLDATVRLVGEKLL